LDRKKIKMKNLERENAILKRLLKDGYFWMNYSSTDCDGCYAQRAYKMTSLDELYDAEESTAGYADGPFRYDLAPELEDGTYDLNEDFCGGSWGDY